MIGSILEDMADKAQIMDGSPSRGTFTPQSLPEHGPAAGMTLAMQALMYSQLTLCPRRDNTHSIVSRRL